MTGFQSGAFQESAFQLGAAVVAPAFQSGAFQTTAFQTDGEAPQEAVPLGGFEMGRVRSVSFKPLLQRIMEARAQDEQDLQPVARKARRAAKAIEVQAAQVALSSGNEDKFKALMAQWMAQKPQLPPEPQVDLYQIFMAQVGLRLRQIEQFEQDEEEAVLALLLA